MNTFAVAGHYAVACRSLCSSHVPTLPLLLTLPPRARTPLLLTQHCRFCTVALPLLRRLPAFRLYLTPCLQPSTVAGSARVVEPLPYLLEPPHCYGLERGNGSFPGLTGCRRRLTARFSCHRLIRNAIPRITTAAAVRSAPLQCMPAWFLQFPVLHLDLAFLRFVEHSGLTWGAWNPAFITWWFVVTFTLCVCQDLRKTRTGCLTFCRPAAVIDSVVPTLPPALTAATTPLPR